MSIEGWKFSEATSVARSGGRPTVLPRFAPILTVCGLCGKTASTVTPLEGRAWYRDHDCRSAA